MHGLQSAQRLVDEILAVIIRQLLCADDTVHVGLHKFLALMSVSSLLESSLHAHLNEVNLSERLVVARLLDVEDRDDVLVVEIPQQLHLSQCSQTEHGVIKRSDLLNSHFLTRRLVERRAIT